MTSMPDARGRSADQAVGPALLAVIVGFVLLSLPYLAWPLNPHPDERRYSIAAAQMMASGDYLVPRAEDGAIRLKKPPLTYYYLVAGFAVLGQTLAGAKALMLASAAGILALTYGLARMLGVAAPLAVCAAGLLAGHRVFFSTANQHIPDMPLILGTTLSLVGVVRILREDRTPVWAYYAAYLGIAYAVLAKGMLALLLLALALIWRAAVTAAGRSGAGLSRHDGLAGGLALIVAGAWFVLVGSRHPDAMVAQFLGDQVTGKVAFDLGMVLRGVVKNTTDMLLPILPGLGGLALALWWGRAARRAIAVTPAVLFLSAWCGVTIVLFAFSTQLYERYTLPAAPALVALLAWLAGHLPVARLAEGLRVAARLFLVLPVLAGLLAAVIAWRFGGIGWGAGSGLATVAVAVLFWRVTGRGLWGGLAGVALIFPLLEVARLPVFATVIAPAAGALVARAETDAPHEDRHRLVLDDAKLVDTVGLRTQGLSRFSYADRFDTSAHGEIDTVVFLSPGHRQTVTDAGFAVTEGFLLRDLDLTPDEILEALRHGERETLGQAHGVPIFIGTRPR